MSIHITDFSLAITAWKTLRLETRTGQERYNRVWEPLEKLLTTTAQSDSPQVCCFPGECFTFPENSLGRAADVFIIANGQAAYLGTLFSRKAANLYHLSEVQRLSLINKTMAKRLAATSWRTIVRDAHFCVLPVDSETVSSKKANNRALKLLFTITAPSLRACPIQWLVPTEGFVLHTQIKQQAGKTFHHQSQEERRRIILEDELEIWQ